MKVLFTFKQVVLTETFELNRWGTRVRKTERSEETVVKTWTRKHTFIHRTHYNPGLWEYGTEEYINGDRTWVIDITDCGLANNHRLLAVNDEEGVSFFSSCLKWEYDYKDVVYSEEAEAWILKRYAQDLLTLDDNNEEVRTHITRSLSREMGYDWIDAWNAYVRDANEWDCFWAEDTERYVPDGEGVWCERSECYYEHEDNCHYGTYGSTEEINGYHESPEAYRMFDDALGRPDTMFGYEVERTWVENDEGYRVADEGDWVGELDIFKGYEHDSSCGVEAVTNILPADAAHIPYVTNLINDASRIMESGWDDSCSTHWTISHGELTGAELMAKFRGYIGIVYAMFPQRLNKSYCRGDKQLNCEAFGRNLRGSSDNKALVVKANAIEIRVPDAVRSTEEMILRHSLFVTIADYAINDKGWMNMLTAIGNDLDTWNRLMYKDKYNTTFTEEMVACAMDFRLWVNADKVTSRIEHMTGDIEKLKDKVLEQLKAILQERGLNDSLYQRFTNTSYGAHRRQLANLAEMGHSQMVVALSRYVNAWYLQPSEQYNERWRLVEQRFTELDRMNQYPHIVEYFKQTPEARVNIFVDMSPNAMLSHCLSIGYNHYNEDPVPSLASQNNNQ